MAETEKKTLEKLDEINLLWILRQISVGNLVRGFEYLFRAFREVRNCLNSACCGSKTDEPAEEEQPEPKKSKRGRKTSTN